MRLAPCGLRRRRSIHSLGCVKTRSLQPLEPIVDILACRVFGDAGAFLNLPFKLFALAGNFVEIVTIAP
jgi:hypothetical protein